MEILSRVMRCVNSGALYCDHVGNMEDRAHNVFAGRGEGEKGCTYITRGEGYVPSLDVTFVVSSWPLG